MIIAIREYDAKLLLAYWLERAPPVSKTATVSPNFVYPTARVAQISWDPATGALTPDSQLPSWVFTEKLVAKPDQLIKRRGKAGLLLLNKGFEESKAWIAQRAGKPQKVSGDEISCTLTPKLMDRTHRRSSPSPARSTTSSLSHSCLTRRTPSTTSA